MLLRAIFSIYGGHFAHSPVNRNRERKGEEGKRKERRRGKGEEKGWPQQHAKNDKTPFQKGRRRELGEVD